MQRISTLLASVPRRVIKGFELNKFKLNKLNELNSLHARTLIGTIRPLHTAPVLKADAEWVKVTFVRGDGSKIETQGKIGDSFLDVVVNNDIDLDGFGACEGTLACSTCHLVFKKEDFDKIEEKVTDEEMDMLDLAYGLCETSRLGCQVCLTKKLDGVEVVVPAGVNDART